MKKELRKTRKIVEFQTRHLERKDKQKICKDQITKTCSRKTKILEKPEQRLQI